MENVKSVGIWVRVSTDMQAQGDSPEHHERRAKAYAEAKGWEVREVYHLEAVSGKSVMEHPEAKRMLADIRKGHISGLIFSKLARLARNTKELLDFSEIFREYQADLISLQESIDTSSPAGRLFYTMIAAMAQWEREEISDRVAASVPIRAKLGKSTGGSAPYGYQWIDKKLIPDQKEATVRKFMYELFLQHGRKRVVARLLNESGHRTRGGKPFSDTTVDRLLRDPIAKGLRRANYTKSQGGNRNWALKPESDWVFTEVEPIVSEQVWIECNHILEEERKKHKRIGRPPAQLFTGFAYCICGGKMYVRTRSPRYVCHKCQNKIMPDDLESVYHEQLRNFVFSGEEITEQLSKADQTIKEREALLETLQAETKTLKKQIEDLFELYHNRQLERDKFGEHYKPLSDRLQQLKTQIPETQGELDFLKIQYLSRDDILSEARDLYSRWSQLPEDDKRRIIETITERVVIGKEDITIHLNCMPAAYESVTEMQHIPRGSLHRPA